VFEGTEVEQRLVKAVAAGELLDVSDEPDRDVRAALVRDLLRGLLVETPDPRGVRLRGARIVGTLDLTDVRASLPLVLMSCEHEDPITLERAHLPYLDLSDSTFPELLADNFVCEHDAYLVRVRSRQFVLTDAKITGVLNMNGASLTANGEPALQADRLTVGGSMFLDEGFEASSDSSSGAVSVPGANVAGQLSLSGARLTATNGPALAGYRLTVGGGLFLDDGFVAGSDSDSGAVRLTGANITSRLSLSGARLTAAKGPALIADGLNVAGDLFFRTGFEASSGSSEGAVRLIGADVTGQVVLGGARLVATNGPALHADRLLVGESLFLNDGFEASSDSSSGTVRLLGAKVTGQLSLGGAKLVATNGPALHADRLLVGEGMFLSPGFTAGSDSGDGTVRLSGANIIGQVDLGGASLAATGGPALEADGLTVGGSLFLNRGFAASSDSSAGTIRLVGSKVAGQVNLGGANLTATDGPALEADGLSIGESLFLNEGFAASSDSDDGTIGLDGADIGGQLSLRNAEIRNTGDSALVLYACGAKVKGTLLLPMRAFETEAGTPFRVDLNGFSYALMPWDATCAEWLWLLAEHTPRYAAQPYQQLAAVYRAAGHDRDVRRILIAQQRDHRRRGDIGGRVRKVLHLASGAFIGYGHRPWRALGFLVAVCVLAGVVAVSAAQLGLAVRPGPTGGPCSTAEAIGMAMDTSVPLLKLGGEKRCEINATATWGQVFYLSNYLLQALGWAFATLFVAGYTGLVRKTT
jgi:hypothetical protein